jgi:hypothetical protein
MPEPIWRTPVTSRDGCRAPDARAGDGFPYLEDDLPEPFERLLDRATAAAGSRYDRAFIERYRIALVALLAQTEEVTSV